MRHNYSAFFMVVLILVISSFGIAQESKIYTDPVDRYQIQLSGDWQEVSSTEATGQRRLVIVFHGHSDQGELRIRKSPLGENSLDQFIKTEAESAFRYLPGYVKITREEPFGGGKLAGKMIEFDFKRYNNPKLARYYFVADGKGNVWTMMFSGEPKVLKNIRPDTDVMARSFKPLE